MAQKLQMDRALKELQAQQDKREEQAAIERNRLAARQWWERPASSNTLAWVHSGGARGTGTLTQDSKRWPQTSEDTIDKMELSMEELTAIHG